MAKKQWKLTLTAMNPERPTETWEVGVPEWLYKVHQKQGNDKALGRLLLVHHVLEVETFQIWEGRNREGHKDNHFVYVGRPPHDQRSLTIQTPAPKGMGFLVFVTRDGTIDEWTWRELRDGQPIIPDGVGGTLLWPPQNKT